MLYFGNTAPDAELVIIYGNCQIPFLATLLAAAHSDKGFLCVLNHAPPGEEAEKPSIEQLQRCRLYLEQYDSQPDLPNPEKLPETKRYGIPLRRYLRENRPKSCPQFIFPSFLLTCMWPFARTGDTRNKPEPGYVWGRYPYGNSVAMRVAARGLKRQEALEAYKRLSKQRMPDFRKVLKKAKIKLETRDAHCNIKIADYVWENFRERHIFLSWGHVRKEAIGVLAERIHDMIQPLLGGEAESTRQQLLAAIEQIPDMDTLEEPIDPAVAAGLGLKFCPPDKRFRWYEQYWTFEEYMTRYLDYDTNW